MTKLSRIVSGQSPLGRTKWSDGANNAGLAGSARDRQRHTRSSVYRPGRLELKNSAIDCMVLDISAGGARIHTERRLGPREAVFLRIGDDFAAMGSVAWQEGDYAGIEFNEPPEFVERKIADIIGGPSDLEKRTYVRVSVLWDAQVIVGAKAAQCEILDASVGGARIRTPKAVSVGTPVQLRCARFGEVEAEVTWANPGELGVRFLEPTEHIIGMVNV